VSARGSGFRSPKIPKPIIPKNTKIPGSRILPKVGRILPKVAGPLSVVMAGLEIKQRKDEGQTNLQTGLGVGGSALGGQLGWMAGAKSGAIAGAALGSLIPGLGTAVGAGVGAIVGGLAAGYGGSMLGAKLADDFSGVNATKERKSRGAGGAIKGGFGLKDQSFKDAPKTQIMTDDKGKPFVGYKSMRNGKLHYSRGPQPGTGTSNPFESFGRAINPGAYKDNDAKLAMKKQRIAQVNSLESYQKQGMAPDAQGRMMKQIGANSNQTQNDLSYRKSKPTQLVGTRRQQDIAQYKAAGMAKTKPNVAIITPPSTSRYSHQRLTNPASSGAGGTGGGKKGSGAGSQTPSFSARNPSGFRSKQETLGLMR
jgi:hypothetical protein